MRKLTVIIPTHNLGLERFRETLRGLRATEAEFAVLVDDDNLLAPDYLAEATRLFAAHPHVGALGDVTIGDGRMVDASAVIAPDLPPKSVAVGVPARVVRQRLLSSPPVCRRTTPVWNDCAA